MYATFANIMDFFYVLTFLGIVFLSIHLKHSNKKFIYYIYFVSTFYGVVSLITFVVIIADIMKGLVGFENCNFMSI